jgi:myo-inositol-1(or 4)-monophosphatase
MNLEAITKEVISLSREVGKFMIIEQDRLTDTDIQEKGLHDFVTHVDKESEKKLINGLSGMLPGSGFLVEEQTVSNEEREYTWIIDPLDGTTNFIHGLPVFAISIALMRDDETLSGIVLDVRADECFHSAKGQPAYCNGQQIRVSSRASLEESLLATGFPYNDFNRQAEYLELLAYLMKNSRGIRRYGSAAVDLAWVACGRFDAFWEYSLKPWDVAAGSFIVQQAGGSCSDFQGGNNYLFGQEIIAGNPKVYAELLDAIGKHFH